ncbi:glycosyltransferase family 4 protein [Trichlorobacter lovleyi]|uniref:glycosyltransferase family 4 protein n=1 Tax=Trichlorobacter lovleyi TaxID=313985 RepID=UPI00224014A8|nr:glycosyltransferase family 4 protein [Trichlorobacter lovleyi]QOX78544.1 glycosyltransferase family 4 protein [Trichlorobacter lovleyi]
MIDKLHVIVVGTCVTSKSGGIANALPGYFHALHQGGISFEFLPTHHPTAWGGKWRFLLASILKILQHIRCARYTGKKIIIYAHVGGGMPSFVRKAILSLIVKFLGVPVVMQLHGVTIIRYLASPFGRFFFQTAVSLSSVLCVLTPWWENLLLSAGIDRPLFVVPNPLEEGLEQIAYSPISSESNKNVSILSMTRLEAGKGVDVVIESLSFLPDSVRLIIAGTGSLLPTLKKSVVELGLEERVTFVGWVGGADKLRLLREADIFCLPSSYDSFGMVFVEAMAHGLPVIALDWGPINDIVSDGVCGILIKQAEPEYFARAAIKLVCDNKLRTRMGINGQIWVREQLGAKVIGEKLRKIMFFVFDKTY